MSKTNMLSVRKVKLHGMASKKWTTADKITQYKGLINLYTRDRKIIDVDTNVARRKQYKELKNLQKSISLDRNQLDNAIAGDKQQLRNTLADHREMQLAYENSAPKKVLENIHQLNFNKRKVLDKLTFVMKQKEQQLINLKLEHAVLEDRLKYEGPRQISIEKEAEIITGKVQDAILRKEAAQAINQTYTQVIMIMRKDSLYFDAILRTIENDGVAQGKCMINATQLGQLATEYLDDRRTDYYTLEKIIMKDMKTHKTDLALAHEQAEGANLTLRQLLRRDSDINTCMVKVEDTHSLTELHEDVKNIEATLSFLKHATLVASFENIFPCLQEQLHQQKRLDEFVRICERDRDTLLNKMNHAELMDNMLKNAMVETTTEYKQRKEALLEEIKAEEENKLSVDDIVTHRHNLIAKVRVSIRQLQQLCRPIKLDDEKQKEKEKGRTLGKDEDGEAIQQPDVDEIDGCKILQSLAAQLTALVSGQIEKLDASKMDDAYKFYEVMTKEQFITREFEDKIQHESLLEGLNLEVSHVLTREDIKKQSSEIVAENTKNDDMLPVFTTKKKKRKIK